jgi:plasmid stabilization system protein ParE
MDYRVMLSAQADRDLEDVVRFLAQKNSVAAERLGNALLDDALSLAHLPRRGGSVRGWPGYRRIVHPPWFLIFYRVDEARRLVEVARIWDARQDPAAFSLS